MAMEKEQPKFRILMFPWLAHGHIFPFLELAKRLPRTNFTIYLCSTSVNLDSIRASSIDDGSVNLLQLQMPSVPELPPELHTTKNLPSNLIPTLLQAFQMSKPSFSDILDSVEPDLLLYDFFQPWAPKLASAKGIPSVYFSIVGTISCCYSHHVYNMGTGSTFPYKGICIPDEGIFRMRDFITPLLKDADEDSFAFGNLAMSSEIVLVKSCREVEDKYMDYLSVLCKRKIVPTGPLLASDANGNDDDDWENSEILKWLSMKNEASTVYISFGSECFLSKEQIAKMAKGLELCSANFLWVIRFPSGAKETSAEMELPEGFLEMVKERGMVVQKWAPQAKILGHPSIGGFVSHCGWSSVIESVYFGVPVVAMPMNSEQPVNARLVVEAGFGVDVEKDDNGFYVGEDLAKAINKVIVDETFSEGLRKRAKGLSEKTREKEAEEVNEAAEQLLRICLKNKKQESHNHLLLFLLR